MQYKIHVNCDNINPNICKSIFSTKCVHSEWFNLVYNHDQNEWYIFDVFIGPVMLVSYLK